MAKNTGAMTLNELYVAANELARKHWGVDYTGTIELVRYMWLRWNGQFQYNRKNQEVQTIRMSAPKNAERTREWVLGILLHELVHWRLYTTGQPYRDCDNEFIAECLRVGAPISGAKKAREAFEVFQQQREIG